MKSFRAPVNLIVVSLVTAVTASCATTRSSREFLALPAASELLHPGDDLGSIVIRENCAGIDAIRDIPDNWNVSLVAKGEGYMVTITPFPSWNSRKSEFPLKAPEISILGRGQWSDCFSMRLDVNYRAGGRSMVRGFVLHLGDPKPWRPDDR